MGKYDRRTSQPLFDDEDDAIGRFMRQDEPYPPRKSRYPEYERQDPDNAWTIPRPALIIILGNFGLWALGLVTYWIGRASIFDILMGVTVLLVVLALWFAIAYIQWRFFWWWIALGACLSTIAFAVLYISLLTGSVMLQQIRFPSIRF